jgi:transposase-like protein
MKRSTYTAEFKAKVVREVLRGDKTLNQIATANGIAPSLVTQWRDLALASLPEVFSKKKDDDLATKVAEHEAETLKLYAEIGRLTTELTWLKKKSVKFD